MFGILLPFHTDPDPAFFLNTDPVSLLRIKTSLPLILIRFIELHVKIINLAKNLDLGNKWLNLQFLIYIFQQTFVMEEIVL